MTKSVVAVASTEVSVGELREQALAHAMTGDYPGAFDVIAEAGTRLDQAYEGQYSELPYVMQSAAIVQAAGSVCVMRALGEGSRGSALGLINHAGENLQTSVEQALPFISGAAPRRVEGAMSPVPLRTLLAMQGRTLAGLAIAGLAREAIAGPPGVEKRDRLHGAIEAAGYFLRAGSRNDREMMAHVMRVAETLKDRRAAAAVWLVRGLRQQIGPPRRYDQFYDLNDQVLDRIAEHYRQRRRRVGTGFA